MTCTRSCIPDSEKCLTVEQCNDAIDAATTELKEMNESSSRRNASNASDDNDNESTDDEMEEASESSSVSSTNSNESKTSQSVDCDSVETTASSDVEASDDNAGNDRSSSDNGTDVPTVVTVTDTLAQEPQNVVATPNNGWCRHRRTMPPKREQEILRMIEMWSRGRTYFVTAGRKLTATHYSSIVPKLVTPLAKTRNKARSAASSEDTNLLENVRKLIKPQSAEANVAQSEQSFLHPNNAERVGDGMPQNVINGNDPSQNERRNTVREGRSRRRSQMALDGGDGAPKMNPC